ncbi:MAG: hypothetical protein JST82_12020 [Bacteroidetes bacterium]|nr:hypothetical protein [Bacteroidota bacterium]
MKKLLLFLCCFAANYCFAQHVTISADKMNVLYIGVPNPITVVAEGLQCKNVNIAIEGAQIMPGDEPCKFNVVVKEPGIVIAKVYTISKGGNKIIGEIEFRVKRPMLPTARVGGKTCGIITRTELMSQIGVGAYMDNFDFDAPFVVNSFTASIIRNHNTIFEKTNTGAKFNNDILRAIQTIKPGDIFSCADVRVTSTGNNNALTNSIELTVID